MANPSFETDLSGWTFTSSQASNPLQASRSTSWATDGQASLDLYASADDAGASDDARILVPATENEAYLVTADLDGTAATSTGSMYFKVLRGNDGGASAFSSSGMLWTGIQPMLFVVRPSTGYDQLGIDVSLYVRSSHEELMMDNVQIAHLPNMLANPGFETDLSGWTATPNAALTRVVGTFTQPGNDSSGVAYLDFNGDGTGAAAVSTPLPLPASPCREYHALATCRLVHGAAPTLQISWYDSGGNLLMTSGGMGTGLIQAQSFAPSNATSAVLSLTEPAVDGGFELQLDDVSFVGEP